MRGKMFHGVSSFRRLHTAFLNVLQSGVYASSPISHQPCDTTANHLSKFNGGIKLSIGEQPGVSSDLGPVELKLESTVKIDPKAPLFRFTHRVCHIR